MPAQLKAAMDGLEARFAEWAQSRDDIRAAIVVGSRPGPATPPTPGPTSTPASP